MDDATKQTVWGAVGRAALRVGGGEHGAGSGTSYSIPEATWATFPRILTRELGAGWDATAVGGPTSNSVRVNGPNVTALLKGERAGDGKVIRRLMLEG